MEHDETAVTEGIEKSAVAFTTDRCSTDSTSLGIHVFIGFSCMSVTDKGVDPTSSSWCNVDDIIIIVVVIPMMVLAMRDPNPSTEDDGCDPVVTVA